MPTVSKTKMKPKPKKKQAGEPAPEPSNGTAGFLDLGGLAKKLGAPDVSFATRAFRRAREAELVQAGTEVDSANVLEDVPRFVGSALSIWDALSPAQRQLVRFPSALLPLIVQEAIRLRDLKTKHDAQKVGDAAGRAERETKARQAMRDGIAERDMVYDSLRNALSDDRLDELDSVVGTADTHEKLARGLEALADFIDRVAKADPEDALALDDYGAGPGRAHALRERANVVREHGQATATSTRRVTQRALDLQDGRVLLLIGKIVRAFRAGRRADATILLPELNRLTRLFETRPRGKGGAKSEMETPAEPPAPAAEPQ